MRFFLILLVLLNFSILLFGEEAMTTKESSTQDILNFARRHQEFRTLDFKENEREFVRLVKEGQSPKILFIGCSDSRVVPDLILKTRPGDLFVIRTAGNFVPPYEPHASDGVSASVEFGVEALNIQHIVVCGHSHCAAIQALYQKLDPTKFGILQRWIRFGEEAKQMTLQVAKADTPKEGLYQITEQISVIYQLEHLMTYPFIKKLVQEGKLALHGWYFKIEEGQLYYYDPKEYLFKPLSSNLMGESVLN
jgi:carbonic anhydrase